MVATTIGIRQLKADAPRLVQRAARGEQIVISRYGKPLAVLGPAQAGAQSPLMTAWQREREAFERLAPKLGRRFRGKYVAVLGGRVVGSDSSHERLYRRLERKHGETPFFIGGVRRSEPALQMPGFTLA